MPAPAPCASTSNEFALLGFSKRPDTPPPFSFTKNWTSLPLDTPIFDRSPSFAPCTWIRFVNFLSDYPLANQCSCQDEVSAKTCNNCIRHSRQLEIANAIRHPKLRCRAAWVWQ